MKLKTAALICFDGKCGLNLLIQSRYWDVHKTEKKAGKPKVKDKKQRYEMKDIATELKRQGLEWTNSRRI